MKKTILLKKLKLTAGLLLSCLLISSCGKTQKEITSISDLNDSSKTIMVMTGEASGYIIPKYIPNANIITGNNFYSGYSAVQDRKVDALAFDSLQLKTYISRGLKGVKLLDETVDEGVEIAVGISPKTKIPDFENRLNDFIAKIKADGSLDAVLNKWVEGKDETLPDIKSDHNSSTKLTVATCGLFEPYSYYKGTELVGSDIELSMMLAESLDADLEFKVYDYDAIIAAAQSGDVDCILANLNATPERREAISFSDPLYMMYPGLLVYDPSTKAASESLKKYNSVDELADKNIASQTGTYFDTLLKKRLPNANYSTYNTYADLINALKTDKIDCFLVDEPVIRMTMLEDSSLDVLDENVDEFDYGYIFPKTADGEKLRDQMNEYLSNIKENGTLQELNDIWFGPDDSKKVLPDYESLPGPNGELSFTMCEDYPPFAYMKDNAPSGLELVLAADFCKEYGYSLNLTIANFDSVIPAVTSGKADFAAASMTITEERAESVNFSESYYTGGVKLVVKKENPTQLGNIFESLKSSFQKTFIREDRYKLFISGIITTMFVTIFSIIFGTFLGFLVFLSCRKGNIFANSLTGFMTWLIQGMPIVVLLMILYYIIFAKSPIDGVWVSIFAFTLTFGSSVFAMLKSGVSAIDKGQEEASFALGFTDRETFFGVILPQAAQFFMPSYKAEIVSLIKATSIVGYIAVQDLTKMGDIVRSRTYEAFFPLIAVAVIYFILAGILTGIVDMITKGINPKKRKKNEILKGVKTDD
ncbi:MAG: transporter substrate-binding domain-containing protein [Lachnospiraceae bacterium]|nr:transporter substrate-binding domain-containing protein [Lachnospiraceae bacterium]